MKGYLVEKRPCGDCRYIRQHNTFGSYCAKLLMAVIPSMHVTYKISKGTCWRSRRSKPKKRGGER